MIDPDSIPLITKGWVVFFTILGWGASELDSLADLMNENAKLRLVVGKKFLASMAAGLLSGLGVLVFYPEWGKLAAYATTFVAAFGGAAYVNTIATALANAISGIVQRVFNVNKP